MAETDPNTPQVIDPELTVDLTRLLQIRGPLGVLNVLDTIVPVVNMGDVVTRTVTVLQPSFRSTDVFSAGILTASAGGTIHADTGPLADGTYDLRVQIATAEENSAWNIEHRNAANTAILAVWSTMRPANSGSAFVQDLAYELAINERLRIVNLDVFGPGVRSVAFIFARRRL